MLFSCFFIFIFLNTTYWIFFSQDTKRYTLDVSLASCPLAIFQT